MTVDCRQHKNGTIRPLRIYWHDGRVWDIAGLLSSEYPSKDEFKGVKYTVLIGDRPKELFRHNNQWYVLSNS